MVFFFFSKEAFEVTSGVTVLRRGMDKFLVVVVESGGVATTSESKSPNFLSPKIQPGQRFVFSLSYFLTLKA